MSFSGFLANKALDKDFYWQSKGGLKINTEFLPVLFLPDKLCCRMTTKEICPWEK